MDRVKRESREVGDHTTKARTANLSLAADERGLARRSSAVARVTSFETEA